MTPIDASERPMAVPTPLPAENLSAGRGPNNAGMSDSRLPSQLRHDGFDLRQVRRVGQVAIYEKSKGSYTGWEIILICTKPGRYLPNGKFVPASECYPASVDWGIRGWTATSLAAAERRFNRLVNRYAKSL